MMRTCISILIAKSIQGAAGLNLPLRPSAAKGRYLLNAQNHYPTIGIYCTEVLLSFCNYMNESLEILEVQVSGCLHKTCDFFNTDSFDIMCQTSSASQSST